MCGTHYKGKSKNIKIEREQEMDKTFEQINYFW